MELVPSVPRERVVRGVVGASAVAVVVIAAALERTATLSLHGPALHVTQVAIVPATLALLRPIVRTNRLLRIEGALDRFECVAVVAARSLFATALFAIAAGGPIARALGVATFACAVGLVFVTLRRDRTRAGFLSRVYRKEEPSYSIERDDEVRGFELLPPVLSGTITDAVIAHVNASAANYRTSEGPRPLARVLRSLPKMIARLDRRKHTVSTLVGVSVCCAVFAFVAPWKAPAATAKAALVAPACVDAIPYFEERLQREPGVGRATLLTHAQDATIPEGSGVVLVVPSKQLIEGPGADVLTVAQSIPCSQRLELRVAAPTYRPFAVSATLTLEKGADEATVLRDAEDQVRELFEPDARVVYNEHFAFGSTEKTFGYRVRHVLRHVSGVKKVHLTVNGSETEVPLGPSDFPTLESLSISAVR